MLLYAEIKELFCVLHRVEIVVYTRILISAQITQPNVIAGFEGYKSRSPLNGVEDPGIG